MISQEHFHCIIHKANDHFCHPNEDQESVTCCNNSTCMTNINQAPLFIEMTSSDKSVERKG